MAKSKEIKATKKGTSIYSSKIFISTSIIVLIGLVVIVFFALSVFNNISSSPGEKSDFKVVKREKKSEDPLITLVSLKPPIEDSDPVRGLKEAPITIVEFGDYECSYCAEMKNTLIDILKEYPQKVRLIWKDLPLTSADNEAYNAAVAARCAQSQGKFWEMHDLLFDDYLLLTRNYYTDIAKELNLNMKEFNQCVDLKKTAPLVDGGIKQANELKIDGTPHFFINDQEISGLASFNDLKKIIDLELGS